MVIVTGPVGTERFVMVLGVATANSGAMTAGRLGATAGASNN